MSLYPSLIIILGIIVMLLFWGVAIYNRLVTLRNRFRNAFAQIDVQLRRRYDLIPNLVETAKSYLKHEKETLEEVTAARNIASSAGQAAAENPGDAASMKELARAEGSLTGALGRLMVTVEAYPDLKASQNMMQLSEELSSTENKVSFARQSFNDAVNIYNTTSEKFPAVMIAGILGFVKAEFFEIEEEEAREAPKVSFD